MAETPRTIRVVVQVRYEIETPAVGKIAEEFAEWVGRNGGDLTWNPNWPEPIAFDKDASYAELAQAFAAEVADKGSL
jgi:hypothetical protein